MAGRRRQVPAFRELKWAALALVLLFTAPCTTQPSTSGRTPRASASAAVAAPSPAPSLAPCAAAQVDVRANGVASSQPVLQLASGLEHPEDLLVDGDEVLIGEYTAGRIARLGGAAPVGSVDRLPVHIPEVEGLARIGDTLYVADQANDRVVTVKDGQVGPFLQLQPVRGLDGVDGIAAAGTTLIVPDSPHGTVLFVGQDGQVQRRLAGFSRPTGAWPLPDGSVLIADENAGTVVKVATDGGKQVLARGLPLADDVVSDSDGRLYAISIGRGSLVQVAGGATTDVATQLRQPQGLAVDSAGNVLVTEYDAGRLDLVVTTMKLQPAATSGPSLAPNQPLCVRLVRGPGFQEPVTIDSSANYEVVEQPGAGTEGSVLPRGCSGDCRLDLRILAGARTDTASLLYRR